MARPLRIEFPGAVYHVIARGNEKRDVFVDAQDYRHFVATLARIAQRLQWRLWTYCLMPNHYHLVVETQEPTLARGMRDLNGIHAQRFNRRHDRVGHLFQGRYKAFLVHKDSYLREVVRYVVLNPVRARLCGDPADWPWSSHRAILGASADPPLVALEDLPRMFSRDLEAGRLGYATFVLAGIGLPDPHAAARHDMFLGDGEFIAKVVQNSSAPSPEVPRVQRAWKNLDELAGESGSRNEAILSAYACGNYTVAGIARHFGLHYSTVSKLVSRMRRHNTRPDPND